MTENIKKTLKKGKVVVIGLDGGCFPVINPLIKEGILPNINKLIVEGVSGPLLSTMPPVTGPAWVSFMTGKSPGSHGIFDFVKPAANDYKRLIVNYNHIKSDTLWSILSNKKKIGIINVPLTYPPPEVNGFVISGMLTPSLDSQYTYPSSLSREIEEKIGPYTLDIWWQSYGAKEAKKFLNDLITCTEKRGEISLYLMKKRKWDLFMTVFIGTDRIQHALWHLLIPENERRLSPKESEVRKLIIKYYQKVDEIVGKILAELDQTSNLIIMSDHGFGPLKGKFSINRWLEMEGFLTYDSDKIKKFRLKTKLGPFIRRIVKKVDPLNLRRKISEKIRKDPNRMEAYSFLNCIDWSKTTAYAASNTEQGIYINLVGREPQGIIRKGKEYDEARDLVIDRLKKIEDPRTKEKMVSRVSKREDIYSGPYVNSAPDIIFFLKEGEYLANVHPLDFLFEDVNWKTGTGTHRMEGIFIGYGNDLKAGHHITDARIIDITPSILNLMNIPIPSDIEGMVLEDIFTEKFLFNNPPRYIEGSGVGYFDEQGETLYSDQETEHLTAQLKGLGYL